MEGNLHRARSSLSSPNSIGSHSTPSPPIGRPATAISLGNDHGNRKVSHGHNRISSESNIPTEIKPNVSTQRSSSALGTAGGYRRPLQGLRNADHTHNSINGALSNQSLSGKPAFSNSKISLHGQDRLLEPLSEAGVFGERDAPGQDAENATVDAYLGPVGSSSDKGLKRSASSAQMRDLKDQVNDLKGRLSTLRDQARADSLKRRSLQSLRTPSPFTHARVDQWYADANSHEDGATPPDDFNTQATTESSTGLAGQPGSSMEIEILTHNQDESQMIRPTYGGESAASAKSNSIDPQPAEPTIAADVKFNGVEADIDFVDELDDTDDDMRTQDGYELAESGDFDDSASESGASSYHDSVQAQVSHEDREDAFDYEHFFLHSAMGSMSRRRMRRKGSSDSLSSEDSVETTRGPNTSQPMGIAAIKTSRPRRGSTGSTSTIDSFATATEGRHTRIGIITPQEYNDEYDDGYDDGYPGRVINLPERARTHTPDTAKRIVFSPVAGGSGFDPRQSHSSLHRRPQSSAAAFQHRPSVSSLSTGTNRSFPLFSKSKEDKGVLTPDGSPDQGLEQISETLMNETASIYGKENLHGGEKVALVQMLQRDDQILVERLVASLGRCVLGLTEAGRASAEGRAYRRKIETARRALEGFE
ncbi:hypothetical protein GGS24DRAFT_68035 [Hypoxylon argillaceum]|nr:hypothetical protein GGS24DRAFT_68035 [Hypoxylon argillaceum]